MRYIEMTDENHFKNPLYYILVQVIISLVACRRQVSIQCEDRPLYTLSGVLYIIGVYIDTRQYAFSCEHTERARYFENKHMLQVGEDWLGGRTRHFAWWSDLTGSKKLIFFCYIRKHFPGLSKRLRWIQYNMSIVYILYQCNTLPGYIVGSYL